MQPLVQLKTTLRGEFRFVKYNSDMEVIEESPKCPNVVLNSGLDRMAVGTWFDRVAVGTGNSTPEITQTQLDAYFAVSSAEQGTFVMAYEATPVPRYRLTRRYRFSAGTFSGQNLAEVSLGWDASGFKSWNRALIQDALGNPTTITMLSDEVLDIIATVYLYPNLDDVVTTVPLHDGAGSLIEELTVTTRALRVGLFNPPSTYASSWMYPAVYSTVQIATGQNANCQCFTGGLAAYTAENPLGSSTGGIMDYGTSNRFTKDDYVTGTYYIQGVIKVPLDTANGSNKTFAIRTTLGSFQSEFSNAIVKTNQQVLSFPVRLTWGRYVPPTP